MGDSLMPTHGLHFRSLERTATMPIMRWTHGSLVALVQVSDQQLREIDCIHFLMKKAQSDLLAHEGLANKTFATSPPDLSIAANAPHHVSRPIFQIGQTPRKLPSISAIFPGRRHLS